ncbi:MAG: hypothetical protein ABI212_02305 [Burkholderiaceae bacterium]
MGFANVWLGAARGLLHGLFLLVIVLPLLPHVHLRMPSDYEGGSATHPLEPPGFMGPNYGRWTPLIVLLAPLLYGWVLDAFYLLLCDTALPRDDTNVIDLSSSGV